MLSHSRGNAGMHALACATRNGLEIYEGIFQVLIQASKGAAALALRQIGKYQAPQLNLKLAFCPKDHPTPLAISTAKGGCLIAGKMAVEASGPTSQIDCWRTVAGAL